MVPTVLPETTYLPAQDTEKHVIGPEDNSSWVALV